MGQIEHIKQAFREIDLELIKNRQMPYSVCAEFAELLFKEIKLNRYKSFIDLGSGDGRVVFMAEQLIGSGIVKGIEKDRERYEKSIMLKKKLNSKAELINDDYLDADLSRYDIIFVNPDDNIYELEKKLQREAKKNCRIIFCSEVYKPLNLRPAETIKISTFRAFIYSV